MQRKAMGICFGALLMVTASARAGLVASPHANPHPSDTHGASAPALRLSFAPVFCTDPDAATTVASELVGDSNAGSEQFATLPAAPDSAVLALSGLLSLGAVQLGRNVRKMHLGALPEWYHDGAVQVGHSTPLDLDLGFTQAALPVCAFARPAEPKGPILFGAQWPDPDRCAPQFSPTPESPRAPPSLL